MLIVLANLRIIAPQRRTGVRDPKTKKDVRVLKHHSLASRAVRNPEPICFLADKQIIVSPSYALLTARPQMPAIFGGCDITRSRTGRRL